jgi:tetratricopeptide (TPR) repeat protein
MARYEWQQDPEFRNSIGQSMNSLDFSTMFDQCPLPILIREGKWDLTWEDNKPQMLHSCFPNSSLVVFDSAGHSPFADQPKKFFDVLKAFIDTLPNVPEARISLWKSRVAKLRQELEASPAYLLKTTGYGRSASREIAAAYTREWLAELNDPSLLLKAGFALYDGEKYNEALEVFKNLAAKTQGDSFLLSMALIWQGHMLDLLGRRDEAVLVYKRVVQMNITRRQTYSQYGLTFLPSAYAQDRLAAPFSRIENQDE